MLESPTRLHVWCSRIFGLNNNYKENVATVLTLHFLLCLLSRVFYNSITQVSTTGASASDTKSGDKEGSDARSRPKVKRTQATSARASKNGDKRICIELSKNRQARYLGLPTTTKLYIYYLDYVIGYRVIQMENIPCTKHEAFPGVILRISTCNEALDSQNRAQHDSETGVVT